MDTTSGRGIGPGVLAGLRVLFVEASAEERAMYVALLDRFGANVTAAATVGEAVEAYSRVRPELIVADIAAPGVGGCDLLRAIRRLPAERGGLTPAVAITSVAEPWQRDDALAAGYDAILAKPAGGEDLVRTIWRLVSKRPERRRAPALVVAETRVANRFVEALGDGDQRAFRAAAQRIRLDAWETLYRAGEAIAAVYAPEQCLVSHLALTEEGKTVEVLSTGANGLVGLGAILCDRPSAHWVQTTVGGTAWRIGVRELRDLADASPTLERALLRAFHTQALEISTTAACNRAHKLDGQIARWILTVCDRTSSSRIRMSHEMISERLGVRRASVSVVVEGLARDGLVRSARGTISIADWDGLRAAACECHRTIEAEWTASARALA